MNFSNKYLQFVIGYIAFSFSILEGLSFLIDNYQFNSKILDYTLLVLVIGFFGILAYQFVISITKTNTQKNTKKINWIPNRAFIFSRNDNTWHSYKADGKNNRLTLVYNLRSYK